ncbi:coagulation factor VII [Hippoglossus hippoglossus]|uniref:coagulation factor VII n=1 Tax=Hippoglossus hippoglossus TaxID=8267 RepID=UPI00148B5297|nr:coagulation factor VII [Hippoglossus hippoglossus]
MASVNGETRRFLFLQLLIASIPACTGVPEGVFVSRPEASAFLRRSRRANFLLEELKYGNLERECLEEKCSYEEAKEIFALPQQLEAFWRTYTAVDQCLSSPCKNGATCTRHVNTYFCKCPSRFHGYNCNKVRLTSSSCRYRNGGCEHFCREFPDRPYICFCAPGYKLGPDNSTCVPQDGVPCGRPWPHMSPRVVNGKACPKGQCPWQALLTANKTLICGAIVLSDQWILTAAHCVLIKGIFNISVGKHDCQNPEEKEQKRRVVKVQIHPGYNEFSYDSDLALLKLSSPLKLGPLVVPICLPARNSTFIRAMATVRHSTVSGCGRMAERGPIASFLQRLVLPRVPLQECRLHTKLNITRNMLCAGHRAGRHDSCHGDSGGPLVTLYKQTWFLVGVVSWGKGCANENKYGVYAKVSNFLDWIENVMSTV